MANDDRPTFSRRNLVRALLGRDIPKPRSDAPAPDRHAAGDAAYAAGDYAAAVSAYRASVREDLSNTAVRFRLGHALYATGQALQARVEFEHVLRLTGGADAMARLGLGLTLLALGKREKAAGALEAFNDPERPQLTEAARQAAEVLAAGTDAEAANLRAELEVLARQTALFPDTVLS